ncbi:MAG: response regulator [Phascolarctobacterium sp.]|nr:response regulator [Phascolarctobacterium sp.]
MSDISLQMAKNSLGSYDLICVWDISFADNTVRIVKDNLQPKLEGLNAEYTSMVDWLAENFIFSEDRHVFKANLAIDVLKNLKKDYYFSIRTQFPDGRIRQFIYLLCPSDIENDNHVVFSIFDLENDSKDIKTEDVNTVAPPKSSFKQTELTGTSFKYVTIFGCIGLLAAFLGVFNIIPHILSVLVLVVCAILMYICAKSVANVYAKAEKYLYQRHDAAVVASAQSLSKVINTEKELDRSRLVFMSCISRDVRTPLNTIVGLTALALKKIENRNYVEDCLNKISHENTELVNLIDNIVDISEAESGKVRLSHSTFSLSELVNEITDSVADSVLSKNQDFNVRVKDVRYEYLVGDEVKIKSVLTNLLTNATKYTDEGGSISLDIQEIRIPKNQDSVRIAFTIEDNGIGISKDYRKEMYSAFSRAIDNNVKKIKGTGLGLALCKRFVDMMDGTIVCESEEGKGSKFVVTLELPIAGMDTRDMVLDPVHILVIDDDEETRDSIFTAVSEMGGSIDVASSYQEAVELLVAKRKYDIVVCDWHNADDDAVTGIRLVRKVVGNDVPIIVSSPFAWKNIEREANNADINGFVQKPCFKSTIYIDIMKYYLHGVSTKQQSHKEEKVEIDLKGLKVLIAEDNDLNWEILAEILETVGATSVRAENGLVCVDKMYGAQEGEFDVILMDVQMPVMDGIEAAKEIRKSKRDYVRNIPIFAMTADSFAETFNACEQAGMNGFVTKPVDLNKLFVELRKIKKA